MTTTASSWIDFNQRSLVAALAELRLALERHAARAGGGTSGELRPEAPPIPQALALGATRDGAAADLPPPALEWLCATFGLSLFERAIVLLCAGMELDAAFAGLCASAQGDPSAPYPTFSLALAALAEPHWSALSPAAPLRRLRLIEIGAGSLLTRSPLRLDERLLHYLAGVQHLDERLVGIVEPSRATGELVPSHRALAQRLAASWSRPTDSSAPPVAQLCGADSAAKQAIARSASAAVGLSLTVLSAQVIPLAPGDLETLIRLWEREAALSASALLLDCDELEATDPARERAVAHLVESAVGALIVSSRERRRSWQRPTLTLDVPRPTTSEQRLVWQRALGDLASGLNGQVEALISQFSLSPAAIHVASSEARGHLAADEAGRSLPPDQCGRVLWDACRVQARPRLDDLAQRIEPAAAWDDLVLGESQRQILREIAAHVRQRARVYERWGFASKGSRGLGISALFAGASGTGKTMAAEVLAGELHLDLYRIDLASVVSKYIGETEKNLRHVFDAAEEGGAILLFDEADALFGKRSEVKDSHDRYANIEISYLLQRMEGYRGLAILTSNLKAALDTAFLRRIRFVIQFPFPDSTQRQEIWRRIFPASTPTENLDPAKLARLNVAGGNIRNIALNAAFLAADAEQPVRMSHLLSAARSEYLKLERPLTEAEIAGWT